MKTDKYTNMIEAFECDLRLAKDGRNSLSDFDADLQKDDSKISKDLELLEELSFLLRNGKAEISLISDGFEKSENTPKSDVQVLFRKDTEQPWEHLIIIKSGNVLSDRMECRKLESIDVLRELAQCGIIELHEEKIES